MRSQKVSRAEAAAAGMCTVCRSTSGRPFCHPENQASPLPPWAGTAGSLSPTKTPRAVQPAAPASKPPLRTSSPGAGAGRTVTVRTSVPWAPVPSVAVKITVRTTGSWPGLR